jgi:hypothetical protein
VNTWFFERVTAGHKRAEHRVDHFGLADHRFRDLVAHCSGNLRGLAELFRRRFVHFLIPFSKAA